MTPNLSNYTALSSVLPRLYSTIQNRDVPQSTLIEWMAGAYKTFPIASKYQDSICFLKIENNQAYLPKGIMSINQIAYKTDFDFSEMDKQTIIDYVKTDNESFINDLITSPWYRRHWHPLRATQSTFSNAIGTPCALDSTVQCNHTYSIRYPGVIETSFKCGYVAISYKRYITDEDGIFLIPDEPEELKTALYHYCMYMYWESRIATDTQLATRERDHHYKLFNFFKQKTVGILNMPSIDELENIKNVRDRLVPRGYFYNNFFTQMTNRENLRH